MLYPLQEAAGRNWGLTDDDARLCLAGVDNPDGARLSGLEENPLYASIPSLITLLEGIEGSVVIADLWG